MYELETQLEILKRARIGRDVSGVHNTIAKVQAGLTKMINKLGNPPL